MTLGSILPIYLTTCAAASIGKLRILVPWKKLGWEPILISLEDVIIRAGPQDDGEVCLGCLLFKYTMKKLP